MVSVSTSSLSTFPSGHLRAGMKWGGGALESETLIQTYAGERKHVRATLQEQRARCGKKAARKVARFEATTSPFEVLSRIRLLLDAALLVVGDGTPPPAISAQDPPSTPWRRNHGGAAAPSNIVDTCVTREAISRCNRMAHREPRRSMGFCASLVFHQSSLCVIVGETAIQNALDQVPSILAACAFCSFTGGMRQCDVLLKPPPAQVRKPCTYRHLSPHIEGFSCRHPKHG